MVERTASTVGASMSPAVGVSFIGARGSVRLDLGGCRQVGGDLRTRMHARGAFAVGSDDRAARVWPVEGGDARVTARDQVPDMPDRRLGDALRGLRPENSQMRIVKHLQATVVSVERLLGSPALGDIPLDAEMAGNPPLGVVEAQVVAFDLDARPVDPALVGLDMKPAAIQEVAPDAASVLEIVPEKVLRCKPEKLFRRRAVLRQHRVVHLGDALMVEDVVEHRVLVDRIVPADRLVQHHEKESVEGLREEQVETIVGVHDTYSGGGGPIHLSGRSGERIPHPGPEALSTARRGCAGLWCQVD